MKITYYVTCIPSDEANINHVDDVFLRELVDHGAEIVKIRYVIRKLGGWPRFLQDYHRLAFWFPQGKNETHWLLTKSPYEPYIERSIETESPHGTGKQIRELELELERDHELEEGEASSDEWILLKQRVVRDFGRSIT